MGSKISLGVENIEVGFVDSKWRITYGPENKMYEGKLTPFFGDFFTVPSGRKYKYQEKEETDTYEWVGEHLIKEKYLEKVRENPDLDLDELVMKLSMQANIHIHHRNNDRSSDLHSDFYDSTDSNHWTM